MPRVLRIINRLNLGGPTFNAALLTKHMAPEFETMLVAGTKQDSEESSDFIVHELGLDYTKIPEMHRSLNPIRDFIAYRKIRKLIREYKPDIVHTHAAKAGTLGRLAAIHEKVPVVLHTFHGHVFHSYFSPLKTKIFLKIERYLASRSSAIVAISERQKFELGTVHKVCPPSKIKVIPLGFDLSRFQDSIEEKRKSFRNKFLIDEDELAIGIIGRLVPVKNHTLFIKAAAKILSQTSKKVRFFLIGDGEERMHLINLCRELKLDYCYFPNEPKKASVTFCSWIHEVDIAVAGLDVIALTSLNEGTPVSLIEAQAGNKPVITTDVGGIENIVDPGSTAVLVPNNDLLKFSESLFRIVEDDEFRTQLSLHGWELVKERFHYTRLITEMKDLYYALLTSSKMRKSYKSLGN